MRLRFHKAERLKHKKIIQALFRSGQSCHNYPLTLFWLRLDPGKASYPLLFSVSVPKRKIKSTVTRNVVKRRIREAYRLQKPEFYKRVGTGSFAVMVIYTAAEPLPFGEIRNALRQVFRVFLNRENRVAS